MEILLCRHGDTECNDDSIVQGQMDSKINGKGKEQSKKLRDRLAEEDIDKVYSSPLTRALETAEIVAGPHDTRIEKADKLKEVGRGKFEGEKSEEMTEEITESETEDYLWKPEGGESLERVKERGVNFLNTLKEEHEGEKVVAISHEGTICSTLLGVLEHSSKNGYRINQENCSINELTWNPDKGWMIHSVNDSSHL